MDINMVYKILATIAGLVVVFFIFYFVLYKFLLNKNYHEDQAGQFVVSMTALFALDWLAFVTLFIFQYATTTVKIGVIFLAAVWFIHFIITVLFSKKRYARGG